MGGRVEGRGSEGGVRQGTNICINKLEGASNTNKSILAVWLDTGLKLRLRVGLIVCLTRFDWLRHFQCKLSNSPFSFRCCGSVSIEWSLWFRILPWELTDLEITVESFHVIWTAPRFVNTTIIIVIDGVMRVWEGSTAVIDINCNFQLFVMAQQRWNWGIVGRPRSRSCKRLRMKIPW